jgi:hypothetical protein
MQTDKKIIVSIELDSDTEKSWQEWAAMENIELPELLRWAMRVFFPIRMKQHMDKT